MSEVLYEAKGIKHVEVPNPDSFIPASAPKKQKKRPVKKLGLSFGTKKYECAFARQDFV
jgi:hypothetical protein